MPPKVRKKKAEGEKTNPGAAEKKTWEAKLTEARFEEDSWRASVSVVVGRSPAEETLIQALALAVPQRKLFTAITRDSALAKVCEPGNPKGKKSDEPPMFYEVMEVAKALLDAGQEVSCDLMAKILKFLLLQIKTDDQRKMGAEQNRGGAKGSPVAPCKERKTKLKRRDDVEPPTFKDDEPDDGPQRYILLLGFYQPQLIGLLDAMGVHVAHVIQLCSEQTESSEEQQDQQGCETGEQSLSAASALDTEKVIDSSQLAVQARNLDLFWSNLRPLLDAGPLNSKLHDVVQLSYTASDVSLPLLTQDPISVSEVGSGVFDGVANLIYDCLRWRRQHQHYQNHVRLISVPSVVRMDSEFVCAEAKAPPLSAEVDMCHYSSLLDLLPPEACSVPLILNCMVEQVVVSTESHLTEEPELLDGPELSEQLVSYILRSFMPLMDTEEEKSHFLRNMLTFVQKKEDEKPLLSNLGADKPGKKRKHPRIIRHHDERAQRLGGIGVVPGFDPSEVEMSMMRFSPVWELIQSVRQRSGSSCWMALKQQLQQSCTDDNAPWQEVERLFHQSVFEAMPLTRLDQQDMIAAGQQTPTAIPWDSPSSYAKQQLHNLWTEGPAFLTEDTANAEQFSGRASTQLDLCDLQRCRLRSLSDWHYAEHLDATIFPQVLQAASEQYICVDTFRGCHDNTLYIYCHNPMDVHRHCKESWGVSLHTDVKFRTYLEHVADTISDWTREEELKRDAEARNSTESPEEPDEEAICAVEEDSLKAVIRKGSLKLEQDRLKEEEMAKKSKKENTPKGKPQREEGRSTSNKKGKPLTGGEESRAETADTGAKTPKESVLPTAAPEDGNAELQLTAKPSTGFTGYSMDGQLIHVSGRLQHVFPSDGGCITVENINFVEGSHLMKVAVMKDGHSFYTHINSVKLPPQHQDGQNAEKKDCYGVLDAVEVIRLKQGSLTAVLDNGIRLSYSSYGPMGECTVTSQETERTSTVDPIPASSSTHHSQEADIQTAPSNAVPPQNQVSEDQPASPSNPVRSLILSLPNGLVLKFLLDGAQGVSREERGILVRQSFPLPDAGDSGHHQNSSLSEELFRIITGQGAVIRYLKDGSTEVLFADGTVSVSQDSGPELVPDSKVQDENSHEEAKDKKERSSERDAEAQGRCWITTTPAGDRICTIGTTHKHIPTKPLLNFKVTDFFTQQVMLTREDHVVSVQNPDGSQIVEHVDGTRITSAQQDSDQGSLSVKERVITVEKDGCATVVMYPDRHMARVLLADGSVVTGNNQGEYQVYPSRAGLLHIQNDGKCVYSSDKYVTSSLSTATPTNQAGIYTMSHTDKVACDIRDLDGNHFQVMDDGHVCVLNVTPAPSAQHDEGELEREEGREVSRLCEKDLINCTRLFLVHEDGSGSELLNRHSVEKLLHQAYSDPTVAVLKEPLPDTQGDFGITLLKPSHQSVWSQWLLAKQIDDITPPNLRNRSWHDFPRRKTSGPPFGTNLSLWGTCGGSAAQSPTVRSCPEVLEIRELCQHQPFTAPFKNAIDSRLKDYILNLMEREQRCEEMQIKDPRTEKERTYARDRLSLSLSFTEEDDASHSRRERNPEDVAGLYRRGLGARNEQSSHSPETLTCFTKSTESKWTERLADHRHELQEEKNYRAALKRKDIVPYFHPENKHLYQSLQQRQFPTMRSSSIDLSPISKSDSAQSFLRDAPQESTPRPLNPTPSQSASHTNTKGRMSERRPTNPTPQSERSQRGSGRQWNPLQVDVTGNPRKTKVRLPTSILSSKPRCLPNQQFLTVEEPVRRKCRTVSLTDPTATVRGFQLLPASVDFGTVQATTSSAITVVMRNVGVDTCRFRVQQPPLSTGLQVIYNPGPVAAGLHVELLVQLFAMCAARAGETEPKYISQDIIINTETEILYLPVTATILPELSYDIWKKNTRSQKK
ncbi:sperm-associated antigen 17 [Salarias fasciatus]|uniref:sperm-associated antigen 17 n=1 Tax=Salarias fasciatus TaxID=181472 RepID=UPI001176DA59|nr:sperm-associated antigen 17 [Salarias fasciatus]